MTDQSLNSNEIHYGGDYESEFEFDVETSSKRKRRNDSSSKLPEQHSKLKCLGVPEKHTKEQGWQQKQNFLLKDAYTRHKEMINFYYLCFPGSTSRLTRNKITDKTDIDVIKENHQFLWGDEDHISTWGKHLAKRYYDKLFKEYCLVELSRYKENKIAMRWRTESEVIEGKGQFLCGNVKCDTKDKLSSWEVNFGYVEHEEKKNALVKVRLCPDCSFLLNFCHRKKEVKKRDCSISSKKHILEIKSNESENHLTTSRKTIDTEASTSNEVLSSNVWAQSFSAEPGTSSSSRDEDFEMYLAEMLM